MATSEAVSTNIGLAKQISNDFNMVQPTDVFDDLYQEALIALWQQEKRDPSKDVSKGLASVVIKRRLWTLMNPDKATQVRSWFGALPVSRHGGRKDDATTVAKPLTAKSSPGQGDEYEVDAVDPNATPEERAMSSAAMRAILNGAADTLSERERDTIIRIIFDDMTVSELAKEEGTSRQAVSLRYQRAKKKLLKVFPTPESLGLK